MLGSASFKIKKNNLSKTRIIIPKKVVPKAVDRNRIKRILKEALRIQDKKEKGISIYLSDNIAKEKTQAVLRELNKQLVNVGN